MDGKDRFWSKGSRDTFFYENGFWINPKLQDMESI
jgi:hypothetical protein